MSSTKPPSGTRDFLPDDVRRREYVIRIVRDVYEAYGFEPLETPAFENIDTLLGKYGEDGNKLIFKILRRGEHEGVGADLALRYDLTVPLARVVAQYQAALPRLFKRYQIQPVWRADRPGRGRFREFYQCDIDAVGSTSPVIEVEVLGAVSEVLVRLGFPDFVIRLNHRAVLTGLLDTAGVERDRQAHVLVALDKLDKVGRSGVAVELAERGLSSETVERCLGLFADESGGASDALVRLERLLGTHESGGPAVRALAEIVELAGGTAAGTRLRIDPGLARGLSYYTGAIMEIAVPDLQGSLGGGGRYDNLIGMFLGRDVPACGFSLGLERIIVVMTERAMFPTTLSRGAVDVVVTFLGDELRRDAIGLAGEMRTSGMRVETYPETGRKLDKALKYATGRRVPLMVILGEDERARGEVTVRDLGTRRQDSVPRTGAAAVIAGRLSGAEE